MSVSNRFGLSSSACRRLSFARLGGSSSGRGIWERVGGDYRVLDWEAVEVCLDLVRQDNGEDPRALAWDRDHEARIQARIATPMVVTLPGVMSSYELADDDEDRRHARFIRMPASETL